MTRVTLYTKPGCHLCEAVEQVIAAVARRRAISVVVRNILDDAADLARYRHDIPIVMVNDVEVARYRLSEVELDAAIDRVT